MSRYCCPGVFSVEKTEESSHITHIVEAIIEVKEAVKQPIKEAVRTQQVKEAVRIQPVKEAV